jgi:hypothetical protein
MRRAILIAAVFALAMCGSADAKVVWLCKPGM